MDGEYDGEGNPIYIVVSENRIGVSYVRQELTKGGIANGV